jgi:hypothetical protein
LEFDGHHHHHHHHHRQWYLYRPDTKKNALDKIITEEENKKSLLAGRPNIIFLARSTELVSYCFIISQERERTSII